MARRSGGLFREFQEFALKGNVVDLAIAVIIGGAFGKIVESFTTDVIMPLINPLVSMAGKDWRTFAVGPGILVGKFLGTVLDFLIIAFVLFLAIRAINRFKRKEEVEAAAAPPDPNIVAQERLTDALDRLNTTMQSRG
ncbi:large conductance mechanosensitive channel protein MscL [Calothrix sp. 336/3]|uniref:large conductance mechanosensitive channel protein MscL n=1 Tax=Calothrix sp. 336/3 TaxID=1337936 RepID=UPI0004E3B216|nr:large conductance mechanosensitive channel protein MscL [Calothrix sp. 336/3]AKG20803.1 mechanosensitive ion channel protein MscL [Calothrix sp. 336/3]